VQINGGPEQAASSRLKSRPLWEKGDGSGEREGPFVHLHWKTGRLRFSITKRGY